LFFLVCGNNRITLGVRLFCLLSQTVGQQWRQFTLLNFRDLILFMQEEGVADFWVMLHKISDF